MNPISWIELKKNKSTHSDFEHVDKLRLSFTICKIIVRKRSSGINLTGGVQMMGVV